MVFGTLRWLCTAAARVQVAAAAEVGRPAPCMALVCMRTRLELPRSVAVLDAHVVYLENLEYITNILIAFYMQYLDS